MNHDLTTCTRAEALWCWRKGQGYTQTRAATLLGVCRTTLWAAETGRRLGLLRQGTLTPPPALRPALARRRAAKGLAKVAAGLGVSRATVMLWESRGDRRLVHYWQTRGFTFV